jgi:hypothetical protein
VPDLTEDQNELLRQVVADFVARTEAETGHAPSQRDLSRILGITQQTICNFLWAECKSQYARWTKAKTRRAATHSQQRERYSALVERVATELATQVRAGVIDSAEVLEDTIRRMPVELPIDPTLLSERSAHARHAAREVRDGNVHRLARRCLVLDVLAATREGLGKEFRTFFANRGTRRDVAS